MSQDEPADSRAFAASYGIGFPLLTDRERAVSRAYTGIDGADNTIPGLVVIRRDGRVAWRQIAAGKDDRLTSAQLLAEVDRALGTTGAAPRGGYQVLERIQLGIEGGGGAVRIADSWRGVPALAVRGVLPLGQFAFAGLAAGTQAPRASFEGGVLAGLRLPLLADTAALQLAATAGLALDSELGRYHAGGRLGVWVALTPRWALHLDGVVRVHASDGETLPELGAVLGVSRLLER